MTTIAWISLGVAFACAAWIAADELRHPQRMWIMNVVWPVTALYFGPFAVWGYYTVGRPKMSKDAMAGMSKEQMDARKERQKVQARTGPTASQTAVSDSHCGAGCTLGDVAAAFTVAALGLTIAGVPLYAEWVADFLAAWTLGVAFQYFTIKPMRGLSVGEGLKAAMKADTLSILTFEVGMFVWMGLVYFVLFTRPHLTPFDPRYWLMMQVAMVIGFFTAYPMNRWLVRKGWKEAMG